MEPRLLSGLVGSPLLRGGGVGASGGNDAYTKLLLHMDGTDASTTFTDSSSSAHSVTAVNQAQIDTAQSKFGGASGLFDGTGDYLQLDGSADFAFGTGDFTIDFWFRFNSVGTAVLYDSRPSGTNGFYFSLYTTSTTLNLFINNSTPWTASKTWSSGTWYHVAVVRNSGVTKVFVDGSQLGSDYTDSNNYLNGTSRPIIGAEARVAGNSSLNGWMDEFRVSVGVARWTGNFTPPTSAYS